MRLRRTAYLALFAALLAVPTGAQDDRLADPEPEPTTTTDADPDEFVNVCVTDDYLFGFCEPSGHTKRLGNRFSVHITPLRGEIEYSVLLDDAKLELGNGETNRKASNFTKEVFQIKVVRQTHLTVKVSNGTESATLDYGQLRIRAMKDVAKDAEDDAVDEQVAKLVELTRGEYRVLLGWWGVAGFVGILGGAIVGYMHARLKQEDAKPRLIAW